MHQKLRGLAWEHVHDYRKTVWGILGLRGCAGGGCRRGLAAAKFGVRRGARPGHEIGMNRGGFGPGNTGKLPSLPTRVEWRRGGKSGAAQWRLRVAARHVRAQSVS